jgi:hypothetical protein
VRLDQIVSTEDVALLGTLDTAGDRELSDLHTRLCNAHHEAFLDSQGWSLFGEEYADCVERMEHLSLASHQVFREITRRDAAGDFRPYVYELRAAGADITRQLRAAGE